MRRSQVTYLLTLSGLLLFLIGALAAWGVASYFASDAGLFHIAFLALIGTTLFVLLLLLYRFINGYLFSLSALSDDARLMLNANPQHRVTNQIGGTHSAELATLLNQFADRFDQLTTERESEILHANAQLEGERNILVALMAELTEGVIICNLDGNILLYNQQARSLLSHNRDEYSTAENFVGLGRSIFDLINRAKLTFALSHLQSSNHSSPNNQREAPHNFDVSTGFVTTVAQNRLARLRLSTCRNHHGARVGYVITLQNVSAEIARMDQMLTSYDLMDEAVAGAETGERAWQLEDMHTEDLLIALQGHIQQRLVVDLVVAQDNSPDQWLKVDSYALLRAVMGAVRDLKQHELTNLQLSARQVEPTNQVAVMLTFHALIDTKMWAAWQNRAKKIDATDATLTLNEMITRHNGTLDFSILPSENHYAVTLHFPISQPQVNTARPLIIGSRAEFYDFDLFTTDLPTELRQQSLKALIYTVFDTETTGLNISAPSEADRDRVISIGAVRIVNGRLLHQETFDQLINPQRTISPESTAIHGITPEMVLKQPSIEQVLLTFRRYANETVFVAHNAAFDMRLLQLNEASSGVQFSNPVVDTLLLSTIIHPNETDHALESIAARLGVTVADRHTALGDALTTAKVFLRLIPLLAEKGIITLDDAIEASKKSYLSRIQY